MPTTSDESLAVLKLKRGEDRRLRAGHLWVFSNEIDVSATPLTALESGQLVRIEADRGQNLGVAYVNPRALVCARILARAPATSLDPELFVQRLASALRLRERFVGGSHYRWVFGESDGLPGLILDRYDDVVIGQISTEGMETRRELIEAAIAKVFRPRVLAWKNDSGARDLEQLPHAFSVSWGSQPAEIIVVESLPDGSAVRCVAPLETGQKTGWFYDQAANRARFSAWLAPRARVLDVCSYVGGWSAVAAAAGAASVDCVDSSALALGFAERNVRAAGSASVTAHKGDAFAVLEKLAASGQRFDAVVLDPPAFIKRKRDHAVGLAAYRKLNQLALRLLEPDGLLVSCSCSYHLSGDELLGAIQTAARHVDRLVQVLHTGGQSPDHPIHPAIPETRYLKAFFCRVSPA